MTTTIAAIALLVCSQACFAGQQGPRGGSRCPAPSSDVALTMENFLEVVRLPDNNCVQGYFPSEGTWKYRLAIYAIDSSEVQTSTFSAADTQGAFSGPLRDSFDLNFEGQRVGH